MINAILVQISYNIVHMTLILIYHVNINQSVLTAKYNLLIILEIPIRARENSKLVTMVFGAQFVTPIGINLHLILFASN